MAFGDFALLLPEDPDVWAFTRQYEGVELLVVASFSAQEVRPEVAMDGELLLGTHPDPGPVLRPWESRILKRDERADG